MKKPLLLLMLLIAFLALTTNISAQTGKVPAREASLIDFLVKESKQSPEITKDLPFLGITVGKTGYIVESKSGAIVSRSEAADGSSSGGFYGAYAEVLVLLLDQNKKESGAGAGQLLKLTGGKWKTIAVNETDYQCADVKSVPKAVLKALKVECN